MLIEILKPDFEFSDERGCLTQLVHQGFKQFNIIFSKKDVLRGNHYHKENREAFFVISGSCNLTAMKDGLIEEYVFKSGDMFLIPQYVIHSFFYTDDTWLSSMYDLGVEHDDGTKDIYTGKN